MARDLAVPHGSILSRHDRDASIAIEELPLAGRGYMIDAWSMVQF